MVEHIQKLQRFGVGEIILNCVDNDGSMNGLDIETLKKIQESCEVPLIACGGAGTISHLKDAESVGASGIAAGSMFIYFGKQKGILINYPKETSLRESLK